MNRVARMRQNTKTVTALLLGMLTFAAVKIAIADVYYLSKSEGSGSSSAAPFAFFTPSLWTPSAESFDSTATYIVKSGNYRLAVAGSDTPVTFNGGLLQFGEGTKYGYAVIYRIRPNLITFANEGASFVYGGFVCAGNVGERFSTSGTITLNSDASKRRMVMAWAYNDCELRHNGALVGTTAQPLYVGGTNFVTGTTWHKGCRLELAGDCSNCFSPITLWTQNAGVTATPEVTLAVGGTTLPSLVTVSANGALSTFRGGSPTLGAVAFRGNNWFECTRAPDGAAAGAVGQVTVTGAFTVANGPVKVVAPNRPPANGTYPVLAFPSDSAVTAADFTLVSSVGSEHCSLAFGTSGNQKVLSLVYEGLPAYTTRVYQTVGTATFGTAEAWSDGTTAAQQGKRYALDLNAFADDLNAAEIRVPATVESHRFAGDSLTIGRNCILRFNSDNPTRDVYFNCAELNLEDGSSVAATKTYYSLAGGTVNLGGTVSVIATSDREARIRSELRGTGTLKFESAASGSSQPYGKLYIYKENTNFFGTIDTTLHRTSYATFDENFQSLYIWYGTSIGGNLETLNRAALILNHYVRFGPGSATPVTIREESNRGILVRNGAVINVTSGRALTIGTPLSLHGELRKAGPDSLTLKGAAAGFGSDGSADMPTEDKNIFAVQAGALQIGSADAVNGMALSFAADTSLVLMPNFDDAALMRYGIRNVKTDTPYTLGESVETLPFSIGEASGTPPPPQGDAFRLGLLTVPDTESARALARAAVQSARYHVRGYRSVLVEDAASEPGVVTFALDYTPVGFCLSVR